MGRDLSHPRPRIDSSKSTLGQHSLACKNRADHRFSRAGRARGCICASGFARRVRRAEVRKPRRHAPPGRLHDRRVAQPLMRSTAGPHGAAPGVPRSDSDPDGGRIHSRCDASLRRPSASSLRPPSCDPGPPRIPPLTQSLAFARVTDSHAHAIVHLCTGYGFITCGTPGARQARPRPKRTALIQRNAA